MPYATTFPPGGDVSPEPAHKVTQEAKDNPENKEDENGNTAKDVAKHLPEFTIILTQL